MAEESAKPPTITTPRWTHVCTCEHPAQGSAGLRVKRGGNAENAGIRALGMNVAGWQNAAWNGVNALAITLVMLANLDGNR